MGNYENLKQSITEVIRTNGNQEITGAVLQSTLLTIISTVGANATFAGIATPSTNPGTPDGPVFYLASESGTYTNFNAIELQDGLSILMWNGSWSSQQILNIDDSIRPLEEKVLGIEDVKKDTGIYTEILQEPSTSWVKKRICKINSRETYKLSIYGDATTSMSSVATANLVDANGNVIELLKIYNTISQEHDDLLFTSNYEGYLEIWTRIENGSLYLTAKNNKILLERVEITEEKINDLKYKTIGVSDAIVDYGWINYADGTLKDNIVESFDKIYKYTNRNYIKISLTTAVYSDTNALVAFYSTPTISSDGYLKSVSVQSNGTQKLESVEMDIPSDCKLIVVTNQARLGDVSIKIMSDTIEDIDLHLESIDEDIDNTEEKINDLKYKTIGVSDAIVDYGWINYADGTLKDNIVESKDKIYKYTNRNYIKISLTTAVYSDANALVAFYSTPTISSDGYLKSVSVQSNGTQKLESVEMDIPSDCKLIVVTNQARLGDVSIKIMCDTIEDIDLHLESIDEDIDKLSNRKYNSVIYESASMPPFEFLNESMVEKHGVVIGKDSTIDTVLAESPCIWYDTSLQKLIMIYTSYNYTDGVMVSTHHYALSNDGINWEKKGKFYGASGVDGTPDSKGTTGPVMVLWNSKYYLFYIGLTSTGYEGGDKTLCLAIGNSIDDFINDTAERRGTIIGVGYGWANLQIWHPSFINVDNKWYCFINATGTVNGVVKERIGYYISDNLDGEWTQSSEHLLQYIDESTRGRQVAIDPSVMLYEDYYIMMYGTLIADNNEGYKGYDHWAYTTKEDFPIGWKYGGIAASPSENYDNKHACKPWLMKFKGKIYHYYTAVNESDVRGIALNY